MARNANRPSEPHNSLDKSGDPLLTQLEIFERVRPRLFGIAYRILGVRAEAEDAVQDTFVRWQMADAASIKSPGAWLTAACTRRAIDMLRAAYRSRVDYFGHWLPEPIPTFLDREKETQMELSSCLSTAFLLMLERLTPKERAAYLLYEIFEMSYADVAASLDMSEPACRKLVSRAKSHIGDDQARYRPSLERQDELLAAFKEAIDTGRPDGLVSMLASDVRLTSDGGGKVEASTEVLEGAATLTFLMERLSERWRNFDWRFTDLNGLRGLVLRDGGRVVAAVTFAFDRSDRVTDIFIMRNPDKLAGLSDISIH